MNTLEQHITHLQATIEKLQNWQKWLESQRGIKTNETDFYGALAPLYSDDSLIEFMESPFMPVDKLGEFLLGEVAFYA